MAEMAEELVARAASPRAKYAKDGAILAGIERGNSQLGMQQTEEKEENIYEMSSGCGPEPNVR